ncbi:MAG: hypothetical protein KF773_11875 [Deltaproteobacteria bacterium]|nr:hypothetical protein [Deltaproteobacteria bacterium]
MLAVIVFNLPALATVLAGALGFAGGYAGGLADGWALVTGCAAMTATGCALEVHPSARLRPRFFWVVPAWFAGLAIGGVALIELERATAGYVALGVAAAASAGLIVRAIAGKPGGAWMAGLVGALAIVIGFQLIGYFRPEWKHAVLYAVNALAMIAAIACGVMVYRARQAADQGASSTTR